MTLYIESMQTSIVDMHQVWMLLTGELVYIGCKKIKIKKIHQWIICCWKEKIELINNYFLFITILKGARKVLNAYYTT